MKIKLVNEYGFSKVVEVDHRITTFHYMTLSGTIDFQLQYVPKRGLPVFTQSN